MKFPNPLKHLDKIPNSLHWRSLKPIVCIKISINCMRLYVRPQAVDTAETTEVVAIEGTFVRRVIIVRRSTVQGKQNLTEIVAS